jgi:hypothetical protein
MRQSWGELVKFFMSFKDLNFFKSGPTHLKKQILEVHFQSVGLAIALNWSVDVDQVM